MTEAGKPRPAPRAASQIKLLREGLADLGNPVQDGDDAVVKALAMIRASHEFLAVRSGQVEAADRKIEDYEAKLLQLQEKLTALGFNLAGNDIVEEIVEEVGYLLLAKSHDKDLIERAEADKAKLLENQRGLLQVQDALIQEKAQVATELASSQANLGEMTKDFISMRADRDSQQREATRALEQLATSNTTLAEAVRQRDALRAEVDRLHELNEWADKIAEALGWADKNDITEAPAEIKAFRDLIEEKRQQIMALREELEQTKQDLARSLRQHGEAVAENEQLRIDATPILAQIGELAADREAARLKIDALEGQLRDLSDSCWPDEYWWNKWFCEHHFHFKKDDLGDGGIHRCCWCGKQDKMGLDKTTKCNGREGL